MQKSVLIALGAIAVFSVMILGAPAEARFLQVDPVGYDDQQNLYAYVQNDPINKLDPTGESTTISCSVDEDGKVGGCKAESVDDGSDAVFLRVTATNSDGSVSSQTTKIGVEGDFANSQDVSDAVSGAFKQLYNVDIAFAAVAGAGAGRELREAFRNEGQARQEAKRNGWTETRRTSPGGRGKFYKDSKGNMWTRDRPRGSTGTSDRGGAWKKYNRTGTKRLGTYDRNLNRIGD